MARIIIQKGDNLIKLARIYQTTPDEIMRNNPQIKDPNKIYAGQELVIGEDAYSDSIVPAGVTAKRSNKDFAKLQPQTQDNINYYRQELNSGRITWDQIPDIYKQHIIAMNISDDPAKMDVVKGIGATVGGVVLADKAMGSAVAGTLGKDLWLLAKGLAGGYASQKAIAYGVDSVSGRNEYRFPEDVFGYTPLLGTEKAQERPVWSAIADTAASLAGGIAATTGKYLWEGIKGTGRTIRAGSKVTGNNNPVINYYKGLEKTANQPTQLIEQLNTKQMQELIKKGGDPNRLVLKTKIDGQTYHALYDKTGKLTGYTTNVTTTPAGVQASTVQVESGTKGVVQQTAKPPRGVNRGGYNKSYSDVGRGKVKGQFIKESNTFNEYFPYVHPAAPVKPEWTFFPFLPQVKSKSPTYVVNATPQYIQEKVPWNPWMNPDYVGEQAPYVSGGDVTYVMKAPKGESVEEQPIIKETVTVVPGYQARESTYLQGLIDDGTPSEEYFSGLGYTYNTGKHTRPLIYKKKN